MYMYCSQVVYMYLGHGCCSEIVGCRWGGRAVWDGVVRGTSDGVICWGGVWLDGTRRGGCGERGPGPSGWVVGFGVAGREWICSVGVGGSVCVSDCKWCSRA